jgi:hypothetical protein
MRNAFKIVNCSVLVIMFCLFSMRPSVTNASQTSFLNHFCHPNSNHGFSSAGFHLDSCRCSFLDNKKQNDVLVCSSLYPGKTDEFFKDIKKGLFLSVHPNVTPSCLCRFTPLRI